MIPELQQQHPAVAVRLRDGRPATIRPLSTSDSEALAAFFTAIPLRDKRFFYPHPLDRTQALRHTAEADSPLRIALVLTVPDGRIAGFTCCDWAGAAAGESVFGLCVAADYQGLGAGRLLMSHLLQIAERHSPPVMTLTVQLANARAVNLYRSLGFSPVREQMVAHDPSLGFDDEPEYYMRRPMRAASPSAG